MVKSFGKPGSPLSTAVLKDRRDKHVHSVCQSPSFPGAMFLEREAQLSLLDELIFDGVNHKLRRNMIVALASWGMGKSAFLDEYCQRLLRLRIEGRSNIIPIAINLNPDLYGHHDWQKSEDMAARLLMSYFLSNPSKEICRNILSIFTSDGKESISGFALMDAVMRCIKEDLHMQFGGSARILIACDDADKSEIIDTRQPYGTDTIPLLTRLIDDDDQVECVFTGSTLAPFDHDLGRSRRFVPLPLLSVDASAKLMRSFISGSDSSTRAAYKFARLSGGHPRTIQAFEHVCRAYASDTATTSSSSSSSTTATTTAVLPMTPPQSQPQPIQWSDVVFEAVVDSAVRELSRPHLTEAEIMQLLRLRIIPLDDLRRNAVLKKATESGAAVFATASDSHSGAPMLTSPLMLRSSLLALAAAQSNTNTSTTSPMAYLMELLGLVGLRDLKEFWNWDAMKDGRKNFESSILCMELLRRAYQFSVLEDYHRRHCDLYQIYSVCSRYSQNYRVNFNLEAAYEVQAIPFKGGFPSDNSSVEEDAASIALVKAMVEDTAPCNKIILLPGGRYFTVLKKEGYRGYNIQLVEAIFSPETRSSSTSSVIRSNNQKNKDQNAFVQCVVDKLEQSDSRAWNQVGVAADSVVHVFVSGMKKLNIDWKMRLQWCDELSRKRVIILDLDDLRNFNGLTVGGLFSCRFDDN